jgi:ABC-type glycerol-3-phosphate transport system substrate-binding protein
MPSQKGSRGLTMTRRTMLGATAVGLAMPAFIRRASAAEPVTLISSRYPALEYYADKMKSAVPGVEVDTRLMPAGEAMQLEKIALSSQSSGLDIVWGNGVIMAGYAKAGWLEPLDDLWEKHKEEFNLGDINPTAMRGVTYDGHIYAMPFTINTLLYAHRTDLFKEAGLSLPQSWEEQVKIAETLNSPRVSGTTLSLKWDMPPYELQAVLNTVGDGWFDKDWRPVFNSPKGIEAIELYKRLAQFAVPGFTAQGNDENAVNLGQGIAATGQQWATRCASMDDPKKSQMIGKIDWATVPGGNQPVVFDCYSISKFSAQDKETVFRIIAASLKEENQRGAAALAVPARLAVLNDAEIQSKYRWYPAISKALEVAQPTPALPEFLEATEIATKRMVQGIIGELPVKEALDTAATEVTDLLTRRGYYR